MGERRVVVGALVVDSLLAPTRVLAARRTRPPELAGRWEFPGGKVEPGESPEEALRRELHEELGLSAVVGRELVSPSGSAWPISDLLDLRLFYCTVDDEDVRLDGSHDEVSWVGPHDIAALDWLDADRVALALVFGPPDRHSLRP
jgi:8-oxo-dGTP diphosphatase